MSFVALEPPLPTTTANFLLLSMTSAAEDPERGRFFDFKMPSHSRQSSGWSIDFDLPKRKVLRRWSTKQWLAILLALIVGTGIVSRVFLSRRTWSTPPPPSTLELEIVETEDEPPRYVVPVVEEPAKYHKAVLGPATMKFKGMS